MPHFSIMLIVGLLMSSQGQSAGPSDSVGNMQEQLHTSDQVTAIVEGPARIKAGETANFTVTLTPAPTFEHGSLSASFGPIDGRAIYSTGVAIVSGERRYQFTLPLPSDAITGIWELKSIVFGGMKQLEIPVGKKVVFDVIPATGVVYPVSAEVGINLDQKQLLRTQADALQRRIQDFKNAVSASDLKTPLAETLRRTVQESIETLNSTESSFRALTTNATIADASKIFFGDLRRSYEDALTTVRGPSAIGMEPTALKLANWGRNSVESQRVYPASAQVVLRSLEQNEAAYNLVADTDSLYFDLKVESVPTGASVSLRRKGDPYQKQSELTNTTIETWSLPSGL